jgi:hypothetical protein
MYLLSIDPITATLITAVIALTGSFVVTILNATILESRRQNRIRETEKKALREALYREIFFTLVGICTSINTVISGKPTSWIVLKKGLPMLLSLEVYHYTRKNPTLFYQLPDAFQIDLFYRRVSTFLTEIDSEVEEEEEGEGHSEQILSFMKDTVKSSLVRGIAGLKKDMLLQAGGGAKGILLPVDSESDGSITKAASVIRREKGIVEFIHSEISTKFLTSNYCFAMIQFPFFGRV